MKFMVSRRGEYLLLSGITLIAVLARFWGIWHTPPGLHFDEAFECVQALDVLHGHRYPVFFEGNYGVEPTLIYLIALFFRLFGMSDLAGRLIAATVGALTVPALHLLVRTVFWRQGRERAIRLGLLSALTLAVLYWHVHFSRLGIEPILVPLNVILALYFLWRGLETRRAWAFIACGAAVGFGPYTYPAARLLPVLVIPVAGHWLLTHRGVPAEEPALAMPRPRVATIPWLGFALAIVAAALVFAPLGLYFRSHPTLLFQRVSQVGVIGEGHGNETALQTVAHNAWRTLGMYNVAGDGDPRNNVPGRPVLDPALSALFLIGLVGCLVRFRQPSYGLPVWWLAVMSVPTVFSEYAPHFRRALGASPAVAILVALGAVTVIEVMAPRLVLFKRTGFWVILVAICWTYGAGAALRDYFFVWARDPALYYAFDVGLKDIGGFVRDIPAGEMAYLSPVRQDHQTLIFVVGQEGRPKTFDGRRCLVLPPQGKAATYINLVTEDAGSPQRLRTYLPDLAEVRRFKDDAGALYAVARRISPSSPQVVVPTYRVEAGLGNAVEILGYDVSTEVTPPGQVLVVTVYWRAKSTLSQDYTAFVHLLGPFNPATGGPLWAQEDSQPGQGTYPTSRWSPGEVVVEEYRLQVPQEAPAGKYSVQAGMYLLATLGRLPVIRNGLPAGDSVTLTAVDIPLRF